MAAARRSGPKRYATYLRCSSDDQKHGDFTTIDTQREIDARHVASLGGVLCGEYADEGKSGTNLARKDWKHLLADAQEGRFDAVCVTYMSHLARGEAYHVAEYLLKEAGVEIVLVQEHFTPDLAGHVNKQMTILMDGMYPKMVSQWTKTKMAQMVEKGYCCGQMPTIGYRKIFVADGTAFQSAEKEPPKRLVVDMAEAEILQRAFGLFVETRSYPAVTDYLRGATGRMWRLDSVIRLLGNDVYRGVQRFGAWANPTAHEAIISDELWQAVREADAARSHARRPKENPVDDFPYYLRGLVWCHQCGGRMTPAGHRGRTGKVCYYECLRALKKQSANCPTRRVNAMTLHNAILYEIDRAANHPTRLHTLIRNTVKMLPEPEDLSGEFKMMERRLVEINRRIARCREAIELASGTVRSLVERIEALEVERVQIEAKHRAIEQQGANKKKRRPDVDMVCNLAPCPGIVGCGG